MCAFHSGPSYCRSFLTALALALSSLGSAVAASPVAPVVVISDPARGQGDAGIGRPSRVDSVMSGGAASGLPSSSVNFDRCMQDDTQLGCANYCVANPALCSTNGGGSGNPSGQGQWEYESGSWGYGAGPAYDYIEWNTTKGSGWCGNGGQRPPQGTQSCSTQPNVSAACVIGDWLSHYMNEGFGGGVEGSEGWVCR